MADEQLRAPGKRLSDQDYNEYWLNRVKSRIVVSASGCWLWQGVISPTWGYGHTTYRGKTNSVHRWMYQVVHNVQLTRDQYVCHTCDVRNCCNPDHLWIGSNSENQIDASRKDRHYESRRMHCERGHEFSPENTVIRKTVRGTDRRVCKLCERIRSRISLGWPEHLAVSLPVTPHGQRPIAGRKSDAGR